MPFICSLRHCLTEGCDGFVRDANLPNRAMHCANFFLQRSPPPRRECLILHTLRSMCAQNAPPGGSVAATPRRNMYPRRLVANRVALIHLVASLLRRGRRRNMLRRGRRSHGVPRQNVIVACT